MKEQQTPEMLVYLAGKNLDAAKEHLSLLDYPSARWNATTAKNTANKAMEMKPTPQVAAEANQIIQQAESLLDKCEPIT